MGSRLLHGLGVLLALGGYSAAGGSTVLLGSPDGRVEAAFHTDPQGRLTYRLARGGEAVLRRSAVGITVDGLDLGEKAAKLGEERYEVAPNSSRKLSKMPSTTPAHLTIRCLSSPAKACARCKARPPPSSCPADTGSRTWALAPGRRRASARP